MAERQQQAFNAREYINNIDQQIAYFTKLKQQYAAAIGGQNDLSQTVQTDLD